ncbi:hypothetical protein Pelo_9576 [Pelomyxa schiedti]|nr:hypothetical protein Pelo_9576 [Pelomyxa schiedti]
MMRTTTAKAQVMAVCCAAIVGQPTPVNGTNTPGVGPCPTMAEWARSPALVRQWACDWVLSPLWDAIFDLPFEGPCWKNRQYSKEVHVSVSPTLGVVNISWFTCSNEALCGCLGMIVKDATAWDASYAPVAALKSWKIPEYVQCNRKWIVGCTYAARSSSLFIQKVVGGAPVGSEVVVESREYRILDVEFLPQEDNTLMLVGDYNASVFVDLEATFLRKELVVKLKIAGEPMRNAQGAALMPDGSPCILVRGTVPVNHYSLVDASSLATRWVFPEGKTVATLQRSHVFVQRSPEDPNFWVFRNGSFTEPSFCKGLTANSLDAETEIEVEFKLHDGVTGFLIGNFSVPLKLKAFHPRCVGRGIGDFP